MPDLLSEILLLGGGSLEREDQFELSYSARKGLVGGILAVKQACFFQYVFGRAVLPKYKAELQFHNNGRCFAELRVKFQRKTFLFLMESWKGGEDLAPLTEDLDRLANHSAGGWLLVFSASPPGQTEARLDQIDGLPGLGGRVGEHRFLTKSENGEDYEFWVGAWQHPAAG